MMAQDQTFSIIVPTRNRAKELQFCLQALAQLDYPHHTYEVIVVDDGGEPELEPVLASVRKRINVTLLRQQRAGPAAARNRGALAAQGRYLAFTDDDCWPTPSWLRTLADRFGTAPEHALGGRTENVLRDNPYATASQLLIHYLYEYYNSELGRARFLTSNNLALPRDGFSEIGGFDPAFRHLGGEDRELCDRWLHLGHGMSYVPEAVVYHAHDLTLGGFWRQHLAYGRGAHHYHTVRAERGERPMRVEPLRFYRDMLRYPVAAEGGRRVLRLTALLLLAQLANATGFLVEAVRRKGTR